MTVNPKASTGPEGTAGPNVTGPERTPGPRATTGNPIPVIVRWLIGLVVIALATTGMLVAAQARQIPERTATVFVSPHPDDEFQMWSLVENRPEVYKIFVSMTRGEQSGFCEPDKYHEVLHQDLGELPASPEPEGRWTRACEEARITSLLEFLGQMSQADPTVPGDFGDRQTFMLPSDPNVNVCRYDQDDLEDCGDKPREVLVWTDNKDRGAVVVFNVGDGDVEVAEVELALRTLLDNRESWGLEPQVPVASMVGAFANAGTRCYSYPHPDHLAVEAALWNTNFGQGPQLGATCYVGRRQDMSAMVSQAAADAAFAVDEDRHRLGAHGRHYGWLHGDMYPLSITQSTLFHRMQSFWVRFN